MRKQQESETEKKRDEKIKINRKKKFFLFRRHCRRWPSLLMWKLHEVLNLAIVVVIVRFVVLMFITHSKYVSSRGIAFEYKKTSASHIAHIAAVARHIDSIFYSLIVFVPFQ